MILIFKKNTNHYFLKLNHQHFIIEIILFLLKLKKLYLLF